VNTANCVVWLLSVVKNAHVFWTRGAELSDAGGTVTLCGRPQPYRHFEQFVRPWLAFVSVCVLPALVIVVCNVASVRQDATITGYRCETSGTQNLSHLIQNKNSVLNNLTLTLSPNKGGLPLSFPF